jgi:hypothetical protein
MDNLSQEDKENREIVDSINAYKDAAEYDQFMFGDFDYSDVWLNDENNDVA